MTETSESMSGDELPVGRCVATCPRCIRQYQLQADQEGKEVRCGGCDTVFIVGFCREVVAPADREVLKTPLAVHVTSARHAAELIVQKTFQAFQLAGKRPTRRDASAFVASIPRCSSDITDPNYRNRLCLSILDEAYIARNVEADEVIRYFLYDVPDLHPNARDLIEAAIIGTFCGLAHAPKSISPSPLTMPIPTLPKPKRRWFF
ncbi:hypothetical protein [Paludisphaera sp.]|uniref:hypothetical protein n=1 Tax=Paludisphaera sp. TaxID=2017432 RepID=UPI00301DC509